MTEEKDLHWFGEWVPFEDDEEKEEAIKYLTLWKKYLLKKFSTMTQFGHDQIIVRPCNGILSYHKIGIKICLKGNFPSDYGYLSPRELGE